MPQSPTCTGTRREFLWETGAGFTGLALTATVFGAVSVIMTLAGLELGARLGAGAGDRSELIASVMLIAVGIAVAAGVF